MSDIPYETTTDPNLLRRYDPDFQVYEYVLIVPAKEHVSRVQLEHVDLARFERSYVKRKLARRLTGYIERIFGDDGA